MIYVFILAGITAKGKREPFEIKSEKTYSKIRKIPLQQVFSLSEIVWSVRWKPHINYIGVLSIVYKMKRTERKTRRRIKINVETNELR